MERLKIALMAGGDSPEREIALQSAAQIRAALDPQKYDIRVIDLHHRDWHYTAPDGRQWQVDKNDFSLTVEGAPASVESAKTTMKRMMTTLWKVESSPGLRAFLRFFSSACCPFFLEP